MRKASLLVVCSIFASIALAVACSSESTPTLTSPKEAGVDGSPPPEVDSRRPYPSFRDDVLPIVFNSCALPACHSSKESNLGILLKYDAAQVYAEFQKMSPTATGEKFVIPGDAVKSYLMVKMEGKQDALNAQCANAPLKNCGTQMPPPDVEKLTAEQIDTFRKWITEGAKDN